MKSAVKKVRNVGRARGSAKNPALFEEIQEGQQTYPNYNAIHSNNVGLAETRPQDIPKRKLSRGSSRSSNASSPPMSPIPFSSSPPEFEDDLNPQVQYQQLGKNNSKKISKEPSWVNEARKKSQHDPALDMDQVAFQTVSVGIEYTETWFRAIWQSCLAVVLFVFIPSILLAVIGSVFVKVTFHNKARHKATRKGELRIVTISLVITIIMSIIKDVIIAVTALHTHNSTVVSAYEIAYAPIIFFIIVTCCLLPLLIYAFAGAGYLYGGDDFKKDSSSKSTPKKEKQLSMFYMRENLKGLQEVILWRDEVFYLRKIVPKWAVIVVSITTVLVCIIRSFSPWILQTMECSVCQQRYKFSEAVQSNASNQTNRTSGTINTTVLILSGVDSLLVSLFLSAIYIYSMLWQFVILITWKRFNNAETGKASLVSKGTTGVVAWWRVYQLLRFFTWSPQSVAGFLRLFIHSAFMLFIVVISALMFSNDFRSHHTLDGPTLIMCSMDVFLLLVGLAIHWSISVVASFFQHEALRLVSLKRLDMANEFAKVAAAGEAEPGQFEGEYHAYLKKFKGRNLRGCLTVLQEMLPVIKDMEAKPLAMLYPVAVGCIAIIGITSCGISMRQLTRGEVSMNWFCKLYKSL